MTRDPAALASSRTTLKGPFETVDLLPGWWTPAYVVSDVKDTRLRVMFSAPEGATPGRYVKPVVITDKNSKPLCIEFVEVEIPKPSLLSRLVRLANGVAPPVPQYSVVVHNRSGLRRRAAAKRRRLQAKPKTSPKAKSKPKAKSQTKARVKAGAKTDVE